MGRAEHGLLRPDGLAIVGAINLFTQLPGLVHHSTFRHDFSTSRPAAGDLLWQRILSGGSRSLDGWIAVRSRWVLLLLDQPDGAGRCFWCPPLPTSSTKPELSWTTCSFSGREKVRHSVGFEELVFIPVRFLSLLAFAVIAFSNWFRTLAGRRFKELTLQTEEVGETKPQLTFRTFSSS